MSPQQENPPPFVQDDELPEMLEPDYDTDSDSDSESIPELVSDVSWLSVKNDGDVSDDDEPPPLVGRDSDDEDDCDDEDKLPDLIELEDENESNLNRKPKPIATADVNTLPGALVKALGPNVVVFDGFGGLCPDFKELLKGKQQGDEKERAENGSNISSPVNKPLAVADAPGENSAPKESLKRPVDCPKLADQGLVRGKERPVVCPRAVQGAKQAEPQEWSTGLFDCCADVQSCLLGAFCPCVLYAQTRRLAFGSSCILYTLAHCCAMLGATSFGGCFLCHWGYAPWIAAPLRSMIRGKYGLVATSPFQLGSEAEGRVADCMVHYWCHSCALCQEYREVKLRTEMEKGGVYTAPPVIEEMEKRVNMEPAKTDAKEEVGGVYYTLLAGEELQRLVKPKGRVDVYCSSKNETEVSRFHGRMIGDSADPSAL